MTKSSPFSNALHSCSGESIPPGSRQDIPVTAMGITRRCPTTSDPFSEHNFGQWIVWGERQECAPTQPRKSNGTGRSRAVLSRTQNAHHEWQAPTTNVVDPCIRLCTQRLIVTGHVHRDH